MEYPNSLFPQIVLKKSQVLVEKYINQLRLYSQLLGCMVVVPYTGIHFFSMNQIFTKRLPISANHFGGVNSLFIRQPLNSSHSNPNLIQEQFLYNLTRWWECIYSNNKFMHILNSFSFRRSEEISGLFTVGIQRREFTILASLRRAREGI